ncbi:MAG: peptidoglycan-binding domain-containing protein [Pseudomonadota bacterium]
MTQIPHFCVALALIGCAPVDIARTPPDTGAARAADPVLEAGSDPASPPSKRCWAPVPSQALSQSGSADETDEKPGPPTPVGPTETLLTDLKEGWFEAPCAEMLTPDFVANLQRALAARGFYSGSITGDLDAPTRAAISAYQSKGGLASDTLSLNGARQLGLLPVKQPDKQ